MICVRHSQIHNLKSSFPMLSSMELDLQILPYQRKRKYRFNISIDQFFSEPHNLRNGDISTSPEMFDDPSAASHMVAVPPEKSLTSGMTDSEIHDTVISKSIQTKAEVSRLTELRPVEEKPIDDPAPISNPDVPNE